LAGVFEKWTSSLNAVAACADDAASIAEPVNAAASSARRVLGVMKGQASRLGTVVGGRVERARALPPPADAFLNDW
jgi:hypothetical protein